MTYSVGFSQSLEILFYIELKTKLEAYDYLTIKDISDKLNIPVPSVKRLVGMLKKSNLIESKKGLKGGLALAKDANEISFYDVFEAIEGESALFKIYNDFNPDSFVHKDEANKMLKKIDMVFTTSDNKMLNELKQNKISDLF